MRRKITRVGDDLLIALTDELKRIGVPDAVLVRVVNEPTPHIVISRPPDFEEAMEASLSAHADALRTLAAMPDEGEA